MTTTPTASRAIGKGETLVAGSFGKVFYVDSGAGTSGNGRSPQGAFLTLAEAISACTADNGDTIYLAPGHAEATTAEITVNKAGISIIGVGNGRLRPTFTATFGAAGDTFAFDAANCLMENVRIVASGASQNAQIDVTAADNTFRNLVIEQGASNLMGVTLASGAHRTTFEDCQWVGTANGPDCAIDVESSASDDCVVRRCSFNASAGWDLGVIRANADTCERWLIEDCTFLKVDTVAIDFNSSSSVSDGIVRNCSFFATAALTSIEDILDPGGYKFFECYAHDGTNATTAAARVPLGTVS